MVDCHAQQYVAPYPRAGSKPLKGYQDLTYFLIVMQALAVLLTCISLRQHFDSLYAPSVKSLDKLITYLQCMRKTSDIAARAYEVAYSIVRAPDLTNPTVWKDIAHMFPEENLGQHVSAHQHVDPNVYIPWGGVEQGLKQPYEFHGGGFDFHAV